ncbi:MAG: HlyD family efflux transporter periplasmic adaptor subunit, partial [Pseudomonadota bacterium]
MNRQLMWSIGLLGAALVIAVLMVVLRPAPAEEERVAEAPLVEAVAFEAAAGPIAVLASGTVQAREEVVVGVQVSGRLTYVHPSFREGGVIGAGDTLLRIEQAEYLNNVRIAQADVAAQDVSVLQAEEEVAVARDELSRFAERQVGNTEQRGATTQILPPTNLDRSAPAPNENGSEEGTSVNGVLATREPQLRSAQAARERAAANLADAQLSLNRTRVTAPFRGLVRQEDAALGSLVQPGQALGTIVSTDAFEVRISLTPDEAALIPGLLSGSGPRIPANVFYDYGGRTYRWPAFIDRASSILDAATRNVEVFLQVPSPLSGG